ncbi:hypothetical protein V5799_023930 [Amblyomma americanum]|uniref:Uncharacterized protein n=1 Tax=Amblyomma americanum TaxID=6943 RepID=A0AAQ4FGE4_AMBAM
MPPFVHQAAPSRFVNSPYHTTAAAWSSTASSTPVFRRWCPWDRFSGHESSVSATVAKRPPLFHIQVLLLLVGTASTTSAILPVTVLLCTKVAVCFMSMPPFVHQAAPSRFVNSPYDTTSAAWSSTASSTPVFRRWCPWDRFSGHESSVAATMAKRPPLFAIQVLLPLVGTTSTTSAILPVTVLLCTKGRSLLPVNASVRSSGGALKICEQSLSHHGCGMVIDSKFNASI